MAGDMDVFNDSFYADCGNMIDCNAKTQINNQLNGFDDENLLTVLRTFQETGCYTPLIKEELKFKIQERRLASGKEELVISETKPAIHELSTADIHRREARKEQNRRAARKYRVKQRAKASVVRQEMDKLESDNQQLMVEIKKLHQEKNELYQILQTHLKECVLGQLSPVVSPEPWQVTTSTEPWFQIPDCLTLTNL